jgi:hypothetical protein
LLVRAARVLGMFWSGIDVQAARIDRPIAESRGVVIEVNDIPAFAFHGTPLPGEGPGVDMGDAIFRAFWKSGRPDVPVCAVSGAGALGVARTIARGLARAKVRPILVDQPGKEAEAALDPEGDAIVIAANVDEIVLAGLGVPAIDVLVELGAESDRQASAILAAACRRRRGTRIRARDGKKAAAQALARVLELARS